MLLGWWGNGNSFGSAEIMKKNKSISRQLDIKSTNNQYKYDIFRKLNFNFADGKSILDAGCGDCSDSIIFRDIFKLEVSSLDIYKHKSVEDNHVNFTLGSLFDLPFKDNSFDYVFTHDVLHHLDEKNQSKDLHI